MSDEICKFLQWDSDFFGKRIARYQGESLCPDTARAAREFCLQNRIECLYLLLNNDPSTLATAQTYGLEEVDVRTTFQREVTKSFPSGSHHIRQARSEDLPALCAIARASHKDSRFYSDPAFPNERCDAMYETWIQRSVEGWADKVLVADIGDVTGYVTCNLSGTTGSIGLIAVQESYRGRGFGRELVEAALSLFHSEKMLIAEVITQGGNLVAQSLYERCGFQVKSRRSWFHAWNFQQSRSIKRSDAQIPHTV
jgi:dTDP-4-amino-4,6-dideoxy-D-galactose acyltransferase